MNKLFLQSTFSITLLILTFSCSNPAPAVETVSEDISQQHSDEIPASAEPAESFHISSYDGSIENARTRMSEIINAEKTQELSAYSYRYDNGSGENPMQGTLYFYSEPQKEGEGDVWSLMLAGSFYTIEYFFDEANKLFAIRQYPTGKETELSAEIFYNKDGSLMKGSWIQRPNDEVIQLADYKGDYWYDFLEGYPFYQTVAQLKKDKSLQYQQ